MRVIYAVLIAVLISGCEGLGLVNARAEKAMDMFLNVNEVSICDKISMRAWRKKYGISKDRQKAYKEFCNRGTGSP